MEHVHTTHYNRQHAHIHTKTHYNTLHYTYLLGSGLSFLACSHTCGLIPTSERRHKALHPSALHPKNATAEQIISHSPNVNTTTTNSYTITVF